MSLHRFKADEAYLIGEGKGPVQAYLDVDGIVAMAAEKGVDAIHPGYGFLAENPALPRACAGGRDHVHRPGRRLTGTARRQNRGPQSGGESGYSGDPGHRRTRSAIRPRPIRSAAKSAIR